MAHEALLSIVPLPADHIHRIHGEDSPGLAAEAYEQELRAFWGGNLKDDPPFPRFDLVLLGMGNNGHTASLFPGSQAVKEQRKWVMADYVLELSMWRITLTPVVINAAKTVFFMVTGADKAERLAEVLEGPFQPDRLPAQIIKPENGRLLWFVDQAAARELSSTRE